MEWKRERDLARREAILDLYEDVFGGRFGDRMFTIATKGIGFEATKVLTVEVNGRKSWVREYDRVLVLLLGSVNDQYKGRLGTLNKPLETYRLLWDQVSGSSEAETIPGFTEAREYGSWLLMITSDEYGLPPVQLSRRVREKPEILDLSGYEREYLVNVFLAYRDTHIERLEDIDFDPSSAESNEDERRLAWAETWVNAAARYFGAPREGGGA